MEINEKYIITADSFGYTISEKKIIQDEKSKKHGEITFRPVGYAGSLEQLRSFLFEKEIRENIDLLNNIDRCIELKNELKGIDADRYNDRVHEAISEVMNDIK